jgi:hypothetical protein
LRGSVLRVSEDGLAANHHFVLPKDGTHFVFLPGDYVVEVYAVLVNSPQALLMSTIRLQLSQEQATAIANGSGVYFDWGPDSKSYHAHIDALPVLNAASAEPNVKVVIRDT